MRAKQWKTARRTIEIERPLVMGIVNVTPDSFSDGGRLLSLDDAIAHAEGLVADGVDILDIGGESTRPGGQSVTVKDELERTQPLIEALAKRLDTPISIDTTKPVVAGAAMDNGAEIINDISGLRWDERLADVASRSGAGLILMHSRGSFGEMHSLPPVEDIVAELQASLGSSIKAARAHGVSDKHLVLDVGLGFGKTFEQNLSLIANLHRVGKMFSAYPLLVGASRKSFIGKLLGDIAPGERLGGSIAAAVVAMQRGASILRVHDVKETVQALKVASALISAGDLGRPCADGLELGTVSHSGNL